jgi:PAS domain-containing protein
MHSALPAEVAEELSALRREVALYHAVLRALPQSAVLVYDQELRCVAVGGETMRMLAPDASSAAGQSVRELIPEAQRAAEVARYEATLRGETMSGDSFHEAHVLTSRYVPLRDEADHIIGGMVVSRIVTDEREETKRRELYQAIVEQSPYAITATDAYRKIVMLNRANATMLGYASTDDLLGQDGISITGSESLEQVDQEVGPSLMAHGVWHGLMEASFGVTKRSRTWSTLQGNTLAPSPLLKTSARSLRHERSASSWSPISRSANASCASLRNW